MKIFLIGGPPKCGKTTLAKELSTKLNIPWISVDSLQNIVYEYADKNFRDSNFPHKNMKGDTNDETYTLNSVENIINAYIAQGITSYNAISILVESQLVDKDDYIIEGYHITPEFVNQIISKFENDNIVPIFLVKTDKDEFIKNIQKSTTTNDWIINKTKNPETFSKITDMVVNYSKYFELEAKKYNFNTNSMDQDFSQQMNQILSKFN
jgi:2-phosphoglycerate kinase